MRRLRLVLFFSVSACGAPGLTSEHLYGLAGAYPAALSGLVRDEAGAALAGATVEVAGAAATSGADGSYRLERLPVGVFAGSATLDGFELATFTAELEAGTNKLDVTLRRLPCRATGCAVGMFCNESTSRCETSAGAATLSGAVKNRCTGEFLHARVGISGKSICTVPSKGSFFLTELWAGGPMALIAVKDGYAPFERYDFVLAPGANTFVIEMEPAAGCGATPADVACTCTQPNCQ